MNIVVPIKFVADLPEELEIDSNGGVEGGANCSAAPGNGARAH